MYINIFRPCFYMLMFYLRYLHTHNGAQFPRAAVQAREKCRSRSSNCKRLARHPPRSLHSASRSAAIVETSRPPPPPLPMKAHLKTNSRFFSPSKITMITANKENDRASSEHTHAEHGSFYYCFIYHRWPTTCDKIIWLLQQRSDGSIRSYLVTAWKLHGLRWYKNRKLSSLRPVPAEYSV